jgi:hypothetical protein
MENEKKISVTRESDRFMLRLPDGMRDQIAESAKENGRSMNAEIVARLQSSYEPTLNSLTWIELFKILQTEAQKIGATITINIK